MGSITIQVGHYYKRRSGAIALVLGGHTDIRGEPYFDTRSVVSGRQNFVDQNGFALRGSDCNDLIKQVAFDDPGILEGIGYIQSDTLKALRNFREPVTHKTLAASITSTRLKKSHLRRYPPSAVKSVLVGLTNRGLIDTRVLSGVEFHQIRQYVYDLIDRHLIK